MNSTEPQGHLHDEHDGPVVTPPDPQVLTRGHEADVYDPASVWSVPILVVVFFVLAFVTTTILFYYLAPTPERPDAHPLAVERNRAPLEERLARISRGKEVDQPRLEPLRIRTGDARAITRPEAPVGNSPEIHPEDLRPSPTTTPDLYRAHWLDTNRTAARVTIDDAMRLVLEKNLLPVSKDAMPPLRSTQLPTAANAGRTPVSAPHFGTHTPTPPIKKETVPREGGSGPKDMPSVRPAPEAPPPRPQR